MIGKRLKMSLQNNRTSELWQSFMIQRKDLNCVGNDLYSLQVYDKNHFDSFDPSREFEKWALAEVSDFDVIPEGMEKFILPGGLYEVFQFKGNSNMAPPAFRYIFMEWLPSSGYQLDHRPHFELLGNKYKKDHLDSEEEIWIPVKLK